MSLRATIICDRCSAIIAEARTAKQARQSIAGYGFLLALPGGLDYCRKCSPDA